MNFGLAFHKGFQDDWVTSFPKDAVTVDIPHAPVLVPMDYFSEEDPQGVFAYRKTVLLAKPLNHQKAFLTLEGVMLKVTVYLNGKNLGETVSGFLPVTYDVTDDLVEGENVFVFKVDSKEDKTIPPFGKVVDYLTFGGIYRPIHLDIVPQNRIVDVFAHGDSQGSLIVKTQLECHDQYALTHRLTFEGKLVKEFANEAVVIENPKLWSPSHPNLYQLTTELKTEKEIDRKTVALGFKDAEFRKDGFYLNGVLTPIIGLNRHQTFPYVGPSVPASLQAEDARILKRIGLNAVRTSHYPQSEAFLSACDRLGLMVIDEVPGWQYVGKDEAWRSHFMDFIQRMVLKERSHPCLIAYGTRIDESEDDDSLYGAAVKEASDLDPYTSTIGVRDVTNTNSHCLEDVYGYNDFNENTLEHGLIDPKKVKGAQKKPILITECMGHMFPTKMYDTPSRRLEHALRYLRILDDALSTKRRCGVIGWCAFDYNTHKDFGSGDHICYHGVMDIFRNLKPAAYAYWANFGSDPVTYLATPLLPGDTNEALLKPLVVFTNAEAIRFYKGKEAIGDFYPDQKDYPHLPHAPIVIDDFIGKLIAREGFDAKDGAIIAKTLNAIAAIGITHIKPSQLISAYPAMRRCKLTYEAMSNLYRKYMMGWGEKAADYRIVALRSGKEAETVILRAPQKVHLAIQASQTELINADTYDACRISLLSQTETGDQAFYDFAPVSIKTHGPIQLLGPSLESLKGGSLSILIRSLKTGSSDPTEATIVIECHGQKSVVKLTVKDKED